MRQWERKSKHIYIPSQLPCNAVVDWHICRQNDPHDNLRRIEWLWRTSSSVSRYLNSHELGEFLIQGNEAIKLLAAWREEMKAASLITILLETSGSCELCICYARNTAYSSDHPCWEFRRWVRQERCTRTSTCSVKCARRIKCEHTATAMNHNMASALSKPRSLV